MLLSNSEEIIRKAERLIRRFGTRNPWKIADSLGVNIIEVPLKKQKGMYKVIKRNRYIFVKQDLDDVMKSIVIWHELGHDQIHRKLAAEFQEFNLFDMSKNTTEYEANLFAAQAMLPDDEILEYIYMGYDAGQIAQAMNSDINLVALKVTTLINRGHSFRGIEHRNNFLK